MQEHELEIINKSVGAAIEKHVNGKIREIHQMLEAQDAKSKEFRQAMQAHIDRVEPAIKKFEDEKAFSNEVNILGERTIFWSKVIGAVGVVILAIKFGFLEIIKYKP